MGPRPRGRSRRTDGRDRVKIIDHYIHRQLWVSTLGILLLLTSVVLLVQSIRIVETVARYGAGVGLFFELALFMLPRVLRIAIPITAFIAVLQVIHRLHGDSELFAIYTAGAGARRLLRPILAFAAGIAMLTAVVTLLLAPWAAGAALDRRVELRSEFEPKLMRDGQFMNPRPGLTAFVRAVGRDRSLQDLFLYERLPEGVAVYTARRGWLQTTPESARLTLQRGVALEFDGDHNLLSRLSFDQYVQKVVDFSQQRKTRVRDPNEMFLPELLATGPEDAEPRRYAKIRAEAHEQLSGPLYSLALPFVAFAGLLTGFNQARLRITRIGATSALGVGLILAAFASKNLVIGNPAAGWVMYAPPLLAILAAIYACSRSRRWFRLRWLLRRRVRA